MKQPNFLHKFLVHYAVDDQINRTVTCEKKMAERRDNVKEYYGPEWKEEIYQMILYDCCFFLVLGFYTKHDMKKLNKTD